MLSMKDIPQLIGYTLGIAYLYIRVVVRVSIYPVINAAIFDIIFQFHGEGSIGLAVGELGTLHLERRNMVGYYNLRSGFSFSRLNSANVSNSPLKMIRRKSLTTCSV